MPARIEFDPLAVNLPMVQECNERQLGTGLRDVQYFEANCLELLAPTVTEMGFITVYPTCLVEIEVEMECVERTQTS